MLNSVCFLITSESIKGCSFDQFIDNPNIGGTEFVCIQLAFELACNYSDLNVTLCTLYEFEINNLPNNLTIESIHKFEEINPQTVIITCSAIRFANNLKLSNRRVILWSHHPHDLLPIKATFQYSALVSIGSYQYLSNVNIYGQHYRIENIPPHQYFREKKFPVSGFKKFVFLGSFAPSKGLHIIIKNFVKYLKYDPEAKLFIMGGTIYKYDKQEIPGLILHAVENIPKRFSGNIKFLGPTGEGKSHLLRNMDCALLNPTGRSEAFPASVLECFYNGLPVIGSNKFGMSEFIPYKTPLIINGKSDLIDAVRFISNQENFLNEQNRINNIVTTYLNSRKRILSDWHQLINNKLQITKPENKKQFNELFINNIKAKLKLNIYRVFK
jgi:glycosyltransferase involved in cell wall biosynthesis